MKKKKEKLILQENRYTLEVAKKLAQMTIMSPEEIAKFDGDEDINYIININDKNSDCRNINFLSLVMKYLINSSISRINLLTKSKEDRYIDSINFINFKYILLKELEILHGPVCQVNFKYRRIVRYRGGKYRTQQVSHMQYYVGTDKRKIMTDIIKYLKPYFGLWDGCPGDANNPVFKIKKCKILYKRDYFSDWWAEQTKALSTAFPPSRDLNLFNKERWKWVNQRLLEKKTLP